MLYNVLHPRRKSFCLFVGVRWDVVVTPVFSPRYALLTEDGSAVAPKSREQHDLTASVQNVVKHNLQERHHAALRAERTGSISILGGVALRQLWGHIARNGISRAARSSIRHIARYHAVVPSPNTPSRPLTDITT